MIIQLEDSPRHERSQKGKWALALLLTSFAFSACGTMSATEAPVGQLRPLDALLEVAAYPNADTVVVLSTFQQLLASHREWQGYDFFGRLAREQPDRRVFFLGLQAVLQARVASQVPLLKRAAWVEDTLRTQGSRGARTTSCSACAPCPNPNRPNLRCAGRRV